jgi:hypothetical protein
MSSVLFVSFDFHAPILLQTSICYTYVPALAEEVIFFFSGVGAGVQMSSSVKWWFSCLVGSVVLCEDRSEGAGPC